MMPLTRRQWLGRCLGGGVAFTAGLPRALAEARDVTPFRDRSGFGSVPREWPAPALGGDGVQSLFLAGPHYQGRPTRIFALVGRPPRAEGRRVPAMVLVHGGGGTAFGDWVRLWTERGYAAIAMDTCGCVPVGKYGDWQRHEHGGPPGWGGLDQLDAPLTDQWMYHATLSVITAHSWLRAQPGIDPARIGLTGISWGGVLTCMAAGLDPRFRFAAPVYGCGHFGGNAVNGTLDVIFNGQPAERVQRWIRWWDPRWYLPHARLPFLWVNGTNDFAFPIPAWTASSRLPRGARSLCLKVRMPHAHGGPGERPEEIRALADALCRQGPPLAQVLRSEHRGRELRATCRPVEPLERAELNFTRASGRWQDRLWETVPATWLAGESQARAEAPADATAAYLNLVDRRGLTVSSEPVQLA